jgi:hypothetical protein
VQKGPLESLPALRTGGVPFVLAYLYFTWAGTRQAAWLYREKRGPTAAAAIASLLVAFVLMTFDPHLTMPGTDLLFSLLVHSQPDRAVAAAAEEAW